MLADYAAEFDIAIAVENNVLAPYNLIGDQNELLLGVTARDLVRCVEKTRRSNVFILLDLGHLKVSAMTLELNADEEIEGVAPFVRAVHLSENNGYDDLHGKIGADSWFWKPLKEFMNDDTVYILEAHRLKRNEIIAQVETIGMCLGNE